MGLYYSLSHFARLSHRALSTRNQAWHRSGADFTATLTENTWNSDGIGTAGKEPSIPALLTTLAGCILGKSF